MYTSKQNLGFHIMQTRLLLKYTIFLVALQTQPEEDYLVLTSKGH